MIELTAHERTGIDRCGEVVSFGVPLPAGTFADEWTLTGPDGAPAPLQTETLTSWPDGSPRWMLCTAALDALGGEATPLTLSPGEGTPLPTSPVCVREEADAVLVYTGVGLVARIARTGWSVTLKTPSGPAELDLFCRTVAHRADPPDTSLGGASGGETLSDLRASRSAHGVEVTVEREGLVRCIVSVTGWYAPPTDDGLGMQFRVRLGFDACSAAVDIVHTLLFCEDPRATAVGEYGVEVRRPEPCPARSRLYGLDGERVEATLEAPGALLFQYDDVTAWPCRYGPDGADECERFGRRLDGWCALAGEGDSGLAVAVRDFWRNAPAAVELCPDGSARALLWPGGRAGDLSFAYPDDVTHIYHEANRAARPEALDRAERLMRGGHGCGKTHELKLWFGPVDPTGRAYRAWLAPLRVLPAPEAVERSGVMGLWSARRKQEFPAAERCLDELFDWCARQVVERRWYGFKDYGDLKGGWCEEDRDFRHGGRWAGLSNELGMLDALAAYVLHAARPEALDMALAMSRHLLELDTVHYHAREPRIVGLTHRHSVGEWAAPDHDHSFLGGHLLCWLLTGDPRTREGVETVAEKMRAYAASLDPASPPPHTVSRGIGATIMNLAWYCREMPRPEMVDALRNALRLAEAAIAPGGPWHIDPEAMISGEGEARELEGTFTGRMLFLSYAALGGHLARPVLGGKVADSVIDTFLGMARALERHDLSCAFVSKKTSRLKYWVKAPSRPPDAPAFARERLRHQETQARHIYGRHLVFLADLLSRDPTPENTARALDELLWTVGTQDLSTDPRYRGQWRSQVTANNLQHMLGVPALIAALRACAGG